jgi:hypothetical protein
MLVVFQNYKKGTESLKVKNTIRLKKRRSFVRNLEDGRQDKVIGGGRSEANAGSTLSRPMTLEWWLLTVQQTRLAPQLKFVNSY